MDTKNKTTSMKQIVKQYGKRVLQSLPISLTLMLTVFVFGPMNIFGNNVDEFEFILSDFIFLNILFAILFSALLSAVVALFFGRGFLFAQATVFSLAVALFLQGNYLNFGLHSLGADGDSTFKTSVLVLSIVIWIFIVGGVLLAFALLHKKHLEILKTVSVVLIVTVLGMQLVGTSAMAFSKDVFISHDDRIEEYQQEETGVLTYDHLGELSKNKNIIYFVIDRFDWRFYEQAKRECPEVFSELDGFTSYEDAMSLYPYTFPSVAYMLSGKHRDWESDMSRKEYFSYAYENSDFLKTLKNSNYKINIYTDRYYGYDNSDCMSEYINNSSKIDYSDYKVVNRLSLSMKMTGLSLYRHLPFFMKNIVTVSTGSFWNNMEYNTNIYSVDMRDLYNSIKDKEFTAYDGENNFSFIHFSGTHPPFLYDEDFNRVSSNDDVMSAMKQSFKIINRYLSEMKRLGLYKDATVVITGDHGWDVDESYEFLRSPPILFKESGAEGELKYSSAQVSHDNLFASILKSEGLEYDGYERPLCDIGEDEEIKRTFYYTKYIQIKGETAHEVQIYEVSGSAREPENWKLIDTIHFDRDMYD